jgi:hypothetical protein
MCLCCMVYSRILYTSFKLGVWWLLHMVNLIHTNRHKKNPRGWRMPLNAKDHVFDPEKLETRNLYNSNWASGGCCMWWIKYTRIAIRNFQMGASWLEYSTQIARTKSPSTPQLCLANGKVHVFDPDSVQVKEWTCIRCWCVMQTTTLRNVRNNW